MKFLISNMFVLIVIAFLLVTELLQSQEDIILSGNAILILLYQQKSKCFCSPGSRRFKAEHT